MNCTSGYLCCGFRQDGCKGIQSLVLGRRHLEILDPPDFNSDSLPVRGNFQQQPSLQPSHRQYSAQSGVPISYWSAGTARSDHWRCHVRQRGFFSKVGISERQ